jgi:hypothetical protein
MKYPVKIGILTLDMPMTLAAARRYGERSMPRDLKRAGFQTHASVAPTWITGADHEWIRISYSYSY